MNRNLTPRCRGAALAGLAALAAFAATLAACSPAPEAPPDASYTVRGEIARLPAEGSTELWIHHEAIPDFTNDRGDRVGMDSMTMPFPVAPDVSLEGYAPGDRIAFDFEVRWKGGGRPMALTRIDRLPEGTRLDFDPPAPAGGDATQPEGAPAGESIPQ